MPRFSSRCLVTCVTLLTGFAHAASAAEILVADAKSQPESLTVAPGGVLIVGSASSPFVYKIRQGSTTAEKFVDASAEGAGTFFFGMLADAATNKVARCEVVKPRERYVRAVVLRGTANAVIDGVIAIQRRGRRLPLTQSSTVDKTASVNG